MGLARALLRDAWVVDSLDGVPESFSGVAVTRSGRVWSARTSELRQAPAVGEERVLAERNRREELIGASESAAQAELAASSALESATAAHQSAEHEREQAIADHRRSIAERDEASEAEHRLAALIERRRQSPDDGPNEGRRFQLRAELGTERDRLERAARDRAERSERIERLVASITEHEALSQVAGSLIGVLESAVESISAQRAVFEAALASDRQAGEQVAAELRSCAQHEATLQTQLHAENEALTETEVACSGPETEPPRARRSSAASVRGSSSRPFPLRSRWMTRNARRSTRDSSGWPAGGSSGR